MWSVLIVSLFSSPAQAQNEFAGDWKLNPSRSDAKNSSTAPDPFLRVANQGAVLSISMGPGASGPFTTLMYPLDGNERKEHHGTTTTSTVTKWEGSALLVNTLVNGPQPHTRMERWKVSRDGRTLTITRTIARLGHESEAVLVYENPETIAAAGTREESASRANGLPAGRAESPVAARPEEYRVDAGTRILLALTSPVNTKHASARDRVQLETRYPILSQGRVVIPPGSFVMGTVTASERAGRVKGTASLYLRFDSLLLPNGVARDLRSRPDSVEGAGVNRSEGKIEGETSKGKDAGTVARTTSAGASVGTIAGGAGGRYGTGAGIGAAVGAAAGLAKVLGSRGQDVVLPKGTTMEMMLDRELRFTEAELNGVR